MSVIDNWLEGKSKAIPTEYNGQRYKSRFEAKVAKFLDDQTSTRKDRIVQYEPKNFLLGNGKNYCPDFYIECWNVWIEAKGVINIDAEEQIYEFSQEVFRTDAEYLVLTPKEARLYAHPEEDMVTWLNYFSRASGLRVAWLDLIEPGVEHERGR